MTAAGGLSLIRVTDDGDGMEPADLALAVERHATSKLGDEDLFNIATLGFRGEALPSIGSIGASARSHRARARRGGARDRGRSRRQGARCGRPPLNTGTCVEVRELFSATPARLKFLKSERAENMAIAEVVKRLAMANPHVGFSLTTGERAGPQAAGATQPPRTAILTRLGRIMGREFLDDALPIDIEREGVRRDRLCGAADPASAGSPASSSCSSTAGR